jgi:hypothetical protein
VRGRWYGVRGHRFVRPALILTVGGGPERRLLAELDDKPWVAEDGESWRAVFTVDSNEDIDRADRIELSVAPNINVDLRSGGVSAEGPIASSGRVSDEPSAPPSVAPAPAAASGEANRPATPRRGRKGAHGEKPAERAPSSGETPTPATLRRRARGILVATPASELAATDDRSRPAASGAAPTDAARPSEPPQEQIAPRPRLAQSRAADIERLTARLGAAEASLERERERREEADQSLERMRSDARRTVAELARVRAELELARTAEREAADTAIQLDAARRDNHELRARHEALRADHDRALHSQAELEEDLKGRATALQGAREELSAERRQHREAESRAATAADAAARDTGHRPSGVHSAVHHTPPPPRTDRPLNPSLRRHPWLRLLVVIVIAGVLLAVYLVLHSTVLH